MRSSVLAQRTKRQPQSGLQPAQKELDAKDPSNRTAPILLKGAMIDDLLPAAVKNEYGWKIDVLRALLRVADPAPKSPTFKLLDRLSEFKKDQFKDWFIIPVGSIQKTLTYEAACDFAGVPLPPSWNSGQWVLQGTQPQNRLFQKLGDPVEVYAYKDPNKPGACIALPRWSNDKQDVTKRASSSVLVGQIKRTTSVTDKPLVGLRIVVAEEHLGAEPISAPLRPQSGSP